MYTIDQLLALEVNNSKTTLTKKDFASREIEQYADFISRNDLADGLSAIFQYCYQGTEVEFMKKCGKTQYIIKAEDAPRKKEQNSKETVFATFIGDLKRFKR